MADRHQAPEALTASCLVPTKTGSRSRPSPLPAGLPDQLWNNNGHDRTRLGALLAAIGIGIGIGLNTPLAFAALATSTPSERMGQTIRAAEIGRELGDAADRCWSPARPPPPSPPSMQGWPC